MDVLDIDMHSGDGFATLAQLKLDLPQTLAASTPRQGKHLYFHPLGVRSRKLGDDLEWIALGKFVVVPPAQGREWLKEEGIAEAPRELVEVVRKARDSADDTHDGQGRGVPRAVRNGTTGILAPIDPTEYRSFPDWFRLMMSCFVAGVAREEFVAWSVSDPPYANDGDEIRRMWDALKPNGEITEATLFRGLRKQPAVAPPPVPKCRRRMSRADRDELCRFARWLARQREDEEIGPAITLKAAMEGSRIFSTLALGRILP
jgi:hypothetical protein